MPKEDTTLRLNGVVDEVLPNAMFRVVLENKHRITAYLAGRLRKNDIKITAGDAVEVEMSIYDMSRGRVIYRKK